MGLPATRWIVGLVWVGGGEPTFGSSVRFVFLHFYTDHALMCWHFCLGLDCCGFVLKFCAMAAFEVSSGIL